MLKFINKIVGFFLRLQTFFFFIQAFQKGLTAFGEEWARLTGQNLDTILAEAEVIQKINELNKTEEVN